MSVRLLDGLRSPFDLKRLALDQLPRLAEEIREEILSVVSRNGGHLSPSLGAVELAVALHYVFDSPHDRILWDVGHQAYAHKLLTGRAPRFSTLRQPSGLSGFLRRDESPHDAFGAGHAATSISAALGILEGMRQKGDRHKAIAVIGDGGLTCGLAFEGLNQAGDLERDLIVVLNHNEMSIAGNVGALSTWFSEKLTGDFYQRLRAEIKRTLDAYPVMGPELIRLIRRVLESSKVLLTPGILFEGFNFQYVGPIDGHNLKALVRTFERVRNVEGPILVHVVTQKGRGYPLAERDPERFHGVAPFDRATGKPTGGARKARTYTETFGDAMLALAARHPNLVAITAAMASGTGLSEFARTFPERFYDVGIAEGHAVTLAAGMAAEGLRPVVAVYSTFLQRGFDQIVHDVALQNLPVIFALDRGGIVGADGPTHHGVFDLSMLRQVPNLVVAAPRDEKELVRLLETALAQDRPFALRYPRAEGRGGSAPTGGDPIGVGQGELLRDPPEAEVLIVAIGNRVDPSLGAAERLASRGVAVRVVNARFVKPLDADLLRRAVRGVRLVLTVEDNVIMGGFGSAVLEWLSGEIPPTPRLVRLGWPDEFIPQGTMPGLYAAFGLDEEGLVRRVESELSPAK